MKSLRGEKYLAPGLAAGLLIALGGMACGGESTCESVFNVSREYPGGSQPSGVEIKTALPHEIEKVEVGFTDPGNNWHDEWLPASRADEIAMSIGPGAVRFRIRIKAPQGSEICAQKPNTKFIQKSYKDAVITDGATVPNPSKFRLDEHR